MDTHTAPSGARLDGHTRALLGRVIPLDGSAPHVALDRHHGVASLSGLPLALPLACRRLDTKGGEVLALGLCKPFGAPGRG